MPSSALRRRSAGAKQTARFSRSASTLIPTFNRGSETLIKKFQEDNVRRRRIDGHEEAALPAQAPMHIGALIVLKAHGHTPTWNPRLNYQGLSDKSQETFRRINLRWHDLRHQYASRLVEHGVPLAQVRDLLGHASITTTERYDNQTLANLQVAARSWSGGWGSGRWGRRQV